MATYYYNGREGDPLAETTIHTDEHCADESGEHSARPVSGLDPDGLDHCGDCGLKEATETCDEVVERTGDVCGRDLPCPYHSDD